MTDSGAISGAAAGLGRDAGIETGTRKCSQTGTGEATGAAARRSDRDPLQTRKLRCPPVRVQETNSLPVKRHQAGSSTSTVESVERISSNPPRCSGSMWRRIRRSSPLPQSRLPPPKLESGCWVCRSTGSICPAILTSCLLQRRIHPPVPRSTARSQALSWRRSRRAEDMRLARIVLPSPRIVCAFVQFSQKPYRPRA